MRDNQIHRRFLQWVALPAVLLMYCLTVWADANDPILPGPKLRGTAEGLGIGSLITTGVMATPKKDDGSGGDIVVWGYRYSGQHGNYDYNGNVMGVAAELNTQIPRFETVGAFSKDPNHPLYSQTVVRLYTTAYTLSALTDEGELWSWGNGDYGTAGCETSTKYRASRRGTYQGSPCPTFGLKTSEAEIKKKVVFSSGGEYSMIAITDDGEVYTWGSGAYGQTTGTSAANKRIPTNITHYFEGEQVVLVGGSYEAQFAVTVDSTDKYSLWGWGDNENCELGESTGGGSGRHTYVYYPKRITEFDPYAKDIIYVNGGDAWMAALLSDGRVYTMGRKHYSGVGNSAATGVCTPQLIMGPGTSYPAVTRLQVRYVGAIAYSPDDPKAVYTWGWTNGSAFDQIYGLVPTRHEAAEGKNVKSIGTTKETVFYLTEDNALYGVGYTSFYKINLCGDYVRSWDPTLGASGGYSSNQSMEWYTKSKNGAPIPGGRRIPYEDLIDVVDTKSTTRTYPSWVSKANTPYCSGTISGGPYNGQNRSAVAFRNWTPYDDGRDNLGPPQ